MSTVGKILVFVNLVLALFIMALIVSTYIGRTDWQRAYKEIENDRNVAKQNTQAAEAAANDLQAKNAQLAKDVEAAKAAAVEEQKNAQATVQREQSQNALAQQEITRLRNNLATSQQELQASQSEKSYLRDQVANLDQQVQKANLRVQESTNAQVDAEIGQRKTQERNERLLTENERLNKELQGVKHASLNAAVAGNGPKRRPPVEEVEGVVKAVDPQSGYVTITIGSDAGLKKGDTLEVYRLKPEAAYLGVVEILEVRPDQAVAKPTSRLRGPIQVGDRVSSNIVTKR